MVVMTDTFAEGKASKKMHKRKMETEVQLESADDVSEESESEQQGDKTDLLNAEWVDSISKILKTNKPKKKKTLVLSKAKKLSDIPKITKPVGFQVETVDGDIKDEKIEIEQQTNKPVKKKRKELPRLRVKPNILEKDKERTLQKIATKGVVQLFNAVRMQQKDVDKKLEEAGPLEVRKEKVLKNIDKRTFLDVLMKGKSQKVDSDVRKEESISVQDPTWTVLKEDFMMGAKLRDWDKELETEDVEIEKEIESESE